MEDNKVYLGNQIEFHGTERCYGVVGDAEYLLVCAYGSVELIRRSLFIENETVMRREFNVSFRPEAPITHQQAVLILQQLRAHKRQWKDCSKKNSIWRKKAMRGYKPRMAFCFCGKVDE